jgi:hypothetical protein
MILLVGTADEYLVQKAKEYSANPILVTEENWTEEIDVGYTGIEEFNNKFLLLKLLDRADEIFYFPKENNDSFELSTATSRGYLEYLLLLVKQNGRTIKLSTQLLGNDIILQNTDRILNLTAHRAVNNTQLWTAGCSYTYGVGVKSTENYPVLLSNMLEIPLTNLAKSGSSIPWSADQILRSDIKKGDTIIWGLTAKDRINWGITDLHNNINIFSYSVCKDLETRFPKRLLLDTDNSLYQFLTHIHQVINFCQKIKAKLLIVGLLVAAEDLLYLHDLPEYYQYFNKDNFKHIDFGTDKLHPGPLQHQDYARAIYEQLQLRKWI